MIRAELTLLRLAAWPAAALAAPFFAGSLGEAPVGGLTHRAGIKIKASPQRVHALLDPGSSDNRWRLRGERIEPIDARAGVFRYFAPAMADRPFEVRVIESAPAARLATTTCCEDRRPFGAVFSSTGAYDIGPTNDGSRVALEETTLFLAGLPAPQLARHVLMMRFALRMDLLRLKYEAETGKDTDAIAR